MTLICKLNPFNVDRMDTKYPNMSYSLLGFHMQPRYVMYEVFWRKEARIYIESLKEKHKRGILIGIEGQALRGIHNLVRN